RHYRIHYQCSRISSFVKFFVTGLQHFSIPWNITELCNFIKVKISSEKSRYSTIMFLRIRIIHLFIMLKKKVNISYAIPIPSTASAFGWNYSTSSNSRIWNQAHDIVRCGIIRIGPCCRKHGIEIVRGYLQVLGRVKELIGYQLILWWKI